MTLWPLLSVNQYQLADEANVSGQTSFTAGAPGRGPHKQPLIAYCIITRTYRYNLATWLLINHVVGLLETMAARWLVGLMMAPVLDHAAVQAGIPE